MIRKLLLLAAAIFLFTGCYTQYSSRGATTGYSISDCRYEPYFEIYYSNGNRYRVRRYRRVCHEHHRHDYYDDYGHDYHHRRHHKRHYGRHNRRRHHKERHEYYDGDDHNYYNSPREHDKPRNGSIGRGKDAKERTKTRDKNDEGRNRSREGS